MLICAACKTEMPPNVLQCTLSAKSAAALAGITVGDGLKAVPY